jgi:hypothetical protein
VLADGAYDSTNCRDFLYKRGVQDCIPPRRNTKVKGTPETKERDFAIEVGVLVGGDKEGGQALESNIWISYAKSR